jgi:hypothetical protein
VQTNDATTDNIRNGATVAIAEKATASSALIASSSYDTIRLLLKKTGSPTGTATICVMDSSANCIASSTFGTQDVSLLTTSFAYYTYQSSTAISIASGNYVGIKFSGGSVGNTLDIGDSATNPYDGTNSVYSTFNGATWTDTSTSEFGFRLSQEVTGAASQESGAWIKSDMGSNFATGGMYVYFTDSTKIPQTITLATSTDDVSYTTRATLSPTQSVGAQWLSFDGSYSVRYVKMTVSTWGTAKSMQLGLYKLLPSDITNVSVSAVEYSGTSYFLYYVGFSSTSNTLYAGKINLDTGQVVNSVTSATGVTTSNMGTSMLSVTKNKVYYGFDNNNAAFRMSSWNRDLSGYTSNAGSVAVDPSQASHACIVATDGAAAASDVLYCLVEVSGQTRNVYKFTNGAFTSLGTVSATSSSGGALKMVDTELKTIIRTTLVSTVNTYTITKSTDTLSSILYTESWLTLNDQQFNFDGTNSRTYRSAGEVYLATSTHPLAYAAQASTLSDPAQCYVETVTQATATAACIDDSIYYRLSDTLIVSGSGTTWTPRVISGATTVQPTTYTELLNTDLIVNTTTINQGVIKMVCDATYPLHGTPEYTGSTSDCVYWSITPTASDTVGRLVPYTNTTDVVHANPQTSYTVTLSVSGDPSIYNIRTIYDGKTVDFGLFDSGGSVGQHLLYTQCYTMQIEETTTGNVLQTGSICANDVTTKPVSLSGITIPTDWLKNTWSHSITRTKTNETNNGLIYAVQKNVEPYNASIFVSNNMLEDQQTYQQWFNFTNVSGISVVNVTGRSSDEAIYFTVWENGVKEINDISYGDPNIGDIFPESDFGLIFAVPAAFIFPILLASSFPKRLAYFGMIVMIAVIGIMSVFRIITLPGWFWAIAVPVVAVSLFAGYKRS